MPPLTWYRQHSLARIAMHMLETLSCVLILASTFQSVLARPRVIVRRTTTIAQSFGIPGVNATYDYIVVGGRTA